MNIFENTRARVILKRGREKSLRNRHPWVFSGAVDRLEGGVEPGDVVGVHAAGGDFLGKGFFNPASQIRVRMLTFRETPISGDFFRRRLEQAAALRRELFAEGDTTAYRLVHSDGDLLPGLVVDRYDEVLVTQFSTLGMARLKDLILELLSELLQPTAIVERSEAGALREEGLASSKAVVSGTLPQKAAILENGIKFWVDVWEGQKTGFFLDQRDNRRRMRELAAGKRLLNCFAYSGGFSVYAALRGVATTSVETSEAALALARENFSLNGLNPREHQFHAENVFEFLRRPPETVYDVIVLDPPAFVKHKKHLNKGARGYKDINRLAIQQVRESGLVLTCSCSAFVSADLFRKIIFSAAQETGRSVQILAQPGHPPDHPINIYHPEGEYLKTLLLRVGD